MSHPLDPFFKPETIAIIGATDRPGTWGYFVMLGLTGGSMPGLTSSEAGEPYRGEIIPVNSRAETVFKKTAYKDVRDIPGPVEAAIASVPEQAIEDVIKGCGEKGVKALSIITAGFSESVDPDGTREKKMAELANSYGMRIVGPNVGGAFDLFENYNTTVTASDLMGRRTLKPTPLSAACQGGYAMFDLITSSCERNMGFGKFIQTGNECDLQVTDFMEYYGQDPETKGIVMYLESVRNGHRFREVANQVGKEKPIIVFKAGRTKGGSRAAQSHTAAMAGSDDVFQGLFRQLNIIVSPTMELLVPLAHAAVELPPMRGRRVGIMTYGGSWGVPLCDLLETEGLQAVEFSPKLQEELHQAGLPPRASTKNPVDLGAAGMGSLPLQLLEGVARSIMGSGEVDALVLHGLGRPIMLDKVGPGLKLYVDFERQIMDAFCALQTEFHMPLLIGNHFNQYQSQSVSDAAADGIRIYTRIDEIACILARMAEYWERRGT